jgi:sugar O-acyltransferase (sialic acid O-acetyltransferase NeuD family)
MADIVLFGNGANASVAYVYFTSDSPHRVVAFTVDTTHLVEPTLHGLPVVPFEDVASHFPPSECAMHIPINYKGVNKLRSLKYSQAKARGYSLVSYISSKVSVYPGTAIGDNCLILEHNVLQPFAQIGNNVVLGCGNHIGHHTEIKDHCFLAAQVTVAGHVIVEPYCFLGVNATVGDGITIAEGCVIGAGALILRDTQAGGVYLARQAQLLPTPASV